MGIFCCKPEPASGERWTAKTLGDIFKLCDGKLTTLSCRRVSKKFVTLLDPGISYELSVEISNASSAPYLFKVVPIVYGERCAERVFEVTELEWDKPLLKDIKDFRLSDLKLTINAEESEDYAKLITDLAIFFIRRPVSGLTGLSTFTLDVLKPINDVCSYLIFSHLQSLSNLLPSGLDSLTLNIHSLFPQSIDYLRLLATLSPKILNYNYDYPDVKEILELIGDNSQTSFYVEPVETEANRNVTMLAEDVNVFKEVEKLVEIWTASPLRSNRVEFTFRIPTSAWKPSVKSCSSCKSTASNSKTSPVVFTTLKHKIFPDDIYENRWLLKLILFMTLMDETQVDNDCPGHNNFELDYRIEDVERDVVAVEITDPEVDLDPELSDYQSADGGPEIVEIEATIDHVLHIEIDEIGERIQDQEIQEVKPEMENANEFEAQKVHPAEAHRPTSPAPDYGTHNPISVSAPSTQASDYGTFYYYSGDAPKTIIHHTLPVIDGYNSPPMSPTHVAPTHSHSTATHNGYSPTSSSQKTTHDWSSGHSNHGFSGHDSGFSGIDNCGMSSL
ncbi:hypothetical protein L596_013347 [Steinernema carpocapsae]|uniref:Uncharacterized protein n=1 Tax=Steinernema carpocapsae TaxID=34508 RepID=A0A4U5NZV3_STECR|nr:hypothetical protein L596_013347 [Steinernema carpocapsae]